MALSKFLATGLRLVIASTLLATVISHAATDPRSERVLIGNPAAASLLASGTEASYKKFGVLRSAAAAKGSVRVIVGLRVPFAPEGYLPAAEKEVQRNDIAASQARLLKAFPRFQTAKQGPILFDAIPFMAMNVNSSELEQLLDSTDVTSVEEDRLAKPTLSQSVPLIGASGGTFGGFNGTGQTVAILDTGVEKTHPDLSGRVVSEACYSSNVSGQSASICPGSAAQSTATNSAMPYATGVCPTGECDHGTHVAGIAAGANGVARGANIIAVQVFSWFSGYSAALSWSSDQILGLQRVNALRSTYNIAAVNMSLGGDRYYSQATCDADNSSIKAIIDTLRSNGVATVIASGNEGYTNSMGAPGCISSAVSVGSTWDAAQSGTFGFSACTQSNPTTNAVACYSNSASFLNLLAPGSQITAPVPGNSYGSWHGTSMATPHVAGAWAVLKSKNSASTIDQVLTALTSTGVSVTDTRNSITKPRISVASALNALPNTLTLTMGGAGAGTVTSSPAGLNCSSSCTGSFTGGQVVTLTATPAASSKFMGWSGACSGTGTCTVTMNTAISVTATFDLKPQVTALSLTNLGGSSGASATYQVAVPAGASDLVISTGGGSGDANLYVRFGTPPNTTTYDCRSSQAGNTESCSFPTPSAGTYHILLYANTTYSGATLTVTYRVDQITYTVTVSKAGLGTGTVTSSPAGISCGVDCTETLAQGAFITLTATPSSGAVFAGWGGDCTGTGTCSLSMTSNRNLTATFNISGRVDLTPILMLLLD